MSQTQTSGLIERYAPIYAAPVDYARFSMALELACYFQNRCCEFEEIIEMFCADADAIQVKRTIRTSEKCTCGIGHPDYCEEHAA